MLKKWHIMLATPVVALGLIGCDVDVEDEGEMPEVEMKGGRLPEVEMRTPEVEIRGEEKDLKVPTDVDIKTKDTTVTVPDVDIKTPAPDDAD